MLQSQSIPAAGSSISLGTSAHETGLSVTNTNALRFWDPETGKRRRRASSSGELRRDLCAFLLSLPRVKSAKVKDTGIFFIATVRLEGGNTLRRTACNLGNLQALLLEALA